MELTFGDIVRWTIFGLVRRFRRGGVAFFGGLAILATLLGGAALGVRALSVDPEREAPRLSELVRASQPDPEMQPVVAPWMQVVGGQDDEKATALSQTPSGDFVVVGRSVPVDRPGLAETILVRTDQKGIVLSRASIIGLGASGGAGSDVSIGDDGAIYATGRENGALNVMRLSRRGETIWAASFEVGETSFSPVLASIQDDGVVVASSESSGDLFLVRMGPSGKEIWRQTIDVEGLAGQVRVARAPDGGIYLSTVGQLDETGQSIPRIIMLSSTGEQVWRHDFLERSGATLHALSPTLDGALYVSGTTPANASGISSPWLARIESDGEIGWETDLDAIEIYPPVIVSAVSGHDIHLIATAPSLVEGAAKNIWLARFERSGGLSWDTTLQGTHEPSVEDVLVTASGDVVLAGGVSENGQASDMRLIRLGRGGIPPAGLSVSDLSFAGNLTEPAEPSPALESAAIATPDAESAPTERVLMVDLSESATSEEPVEAVSSPTIDIEPATDTETVSEAPVVPEPAPAVRRFSCQFTCSTGAPDNIRFPISRNFSVPIGTDPAGYAAGLDADWFEVCSQSGGEADLEGPPPSCR